MGGQADGECSLRQLVAHAVIRQRMDALPSDVARLLIPVYAAAGRGEKAMVSAFTYFPGWEA